LAVADGQHILSFAQAQEAARARFADLARRDRGEATVGPYTVRECVDEYVAWLKQPWSRGYAMVEKHYGHLAPSYIVDAIRTSGPRFEIEADRKLGAVDMAE